MPIYEYKCRDCGDQHEIIQKINDAPMSHCPKCGGEMKKMFSSPAIQFKGSGFYKTDYAAGSSGGSKSESKGEGKSESSAETKSETKSETKTETRSDSKSSD